MQKLHILAAAIAVTATACAKPVDEFQPSAIVALERAALDRWGKGDPQGYLDTYAPDVTYFDPTQEKRVDGLTAMQTLYAPIKGKINVDHYEMIDPKVQRRGDVAVLSFNLVSYGKMPSGELVPFRWNSTEVYERRDGQWRIVHSHWSFTKPK